MKDTKTSFALAYLLDLTYETGSIDCTCRLYPFDSY